MRTNMLFRRFIKCSREVKLVLFKSYCVCLYDACLWSNYTVGCLSKLKLCDHKCIKMFLVLRKVTVYLRFYWNLNYQVLILFYTTVVLFSGVLDANVPIYWCHVFVSYSCVCNCAFILYSFLV